MKCPRPRREFGIRMACLVLGTAFLLDMPELCGGTETQSGTVARRPAATTQASDDEVPAGLAEDRLRERRFWRKLRSGSPLAKRGVDSVAVPLLVPPEGPQREQWLKQWNEWVHCRAYWRRRSHAAALSKILGETPADRQGEAKRFVTLFVAVHNRSDYVLRLEEQAWSGLAENILCHGLGTIRPNETRAACARVRIGQQRRSLGAGSQSSRPRATELRLPLKVQRNPRKRVSRRRAKRLRKLQLEFMLTIRLSDSPDLPLARVASQIALDEGADRRHQNRVRQFLKN